MLRNARGVGVSNQSSCRWVFMAGNYYHRMPGIHRRVLAGGSPVILNHGLRGATQGTRSSGWRDWNLLQRDRAFEREGVGGAADEDGVFMLLGFPALLRHIPPGEFLR